MQQKISVDDFIDSVQDAADTSRRTIRFRNSHAANLLLSQKWIAWRDRRGALLPADSA